MKSYFSMVVIGLFTSLASNVSLGLDVACVKTQVIRGNACNNLVVGFDFSACGEGAPRNRAARSSCVNQKAVAFVKNPGNLYIATYAAPLKEGEGWRFLTVRSETRAGEAPAAAGTGVAAGVASGEMQLQVKNKDGSPVTETPTAVTSEPLPPVVEPAKPLPSVAVLPVVESGPIKETDKEIVKEEKKEEVETKDGEKITKTESVEVTKEEAGGCDLCEKEKSVGIKHSGFVDFYYMSSTSNPAAVTPGASGSSTISAPPAGNVPYRAFDIYHDTFNVALAELTLKKDFEKVGGQVDFGFGNDASVMSPNDIAGQNILQAKIYYKFDDRLKLTVGKMFTHVTLEEPYSTENMNYSRSLIFTFAEPLVHTGASLEFKLVPKVIDLTLYAYNGWSGTYQTNQKMAGLRLGIAASNDVAVTYNMIMGTQPTAQGGSRQEHEVNLTWKPEKDMALAAEYVWGYQTMIFPGQDAQWNAAELMVRRTWGKYSLSPRIEYFFDPQGYAISGALAATPTTGYTTQNIVSGTLTNSYEIEEGAKAIFELREDSSDQNVFKDMNGKPSMSQLTGTIAFLYEF